MKLPRRVAALATRRLTHHGDVLDAALRAATDHELEALANATDAAELDVDQRWPGIAAAWLALLRWEEERHEAPHSDLRWYAPLPTIEPRAVLEARAVLDTPLPADADDRAAHLIARARARHVLAADATHPQEPREGDTPHEQA